MKTEHHDYIPPPEHDDFEPDLRRAFEFANETVDPSLVDHSKIKVAKDSLLLSGDGTFYTLQGEGPTMGFPCVFCRLHLCNLRCTWCDAFYTWNPKTEEFWTESYRLEFEEAAKQIVDTWKGPDTTEKIVVFTGGEPLIQRHQIDRVFELLNPKGIRYDIENEWNMEIETNGTRMPTELQLAIAQFNVSPKVANSDNNLYSMYKPRVIEALANANSTFKFVCRNEEDLNEVEQLYLPHIDLSQLIIMPEGIRSEEIDKHLQDLYEPCMKRGWRLLGRMQAQFADGARRGV